MKKLLFLAFALLVTFQISAQTWTVDPNHSSMNFTIQHSGISLVAGKFTDFDGTATLTNADLSDLKTQFTVRTKSINTSVEMRDNHLRSADFFEVEKYPTMTFKSTRLLATGKPDQYLLYGELTIKNVTKTVIFDVNYGGISKSDKGEKIGFSAKTTINRFDYNINYDPGAAGIGKDVNITVYLQFAKDNKK